MKYIIYPPDKIEGAVRLPASKSISNRALILNALGGNPLPVKNLSDSDDTRVMIRAFSSGKSTIDVGAAGTSMRFLTAYLAQAEGEWTLTGSERMKNRPIELLVNALRETGAEIDYLEKTGFPPLKITGRKLQGGTIELDGSISSQYISALMMVAPTMENGLTIRLKGEVISRPYIQMTRKMMEDFGVSLSVEGSVIIIPAQPVRPVSYEVESDWSAASYWYEILALSKRQDDQITLYGLKPDSLQGDSKVVDIFKELGVITQFNNEGVILSKKNTHSSFLKYNFVNEPDLAQTVTTTCCLLDIPFLFTGLQSLKIKETDRITALKNELKKLGYSITDKKNSILEWNKEYTDPGTDEAIDTYEDHRMAMSFAPAALTKGHITIADPEVVTKSYPGYWNDLKKTGFKITEYK